MLLKAKGLSKHYGAFPALTTSRWLSPMANLYPSLDQTAPARPPSSTCSPAFCCPPKAASSSRAATSPASARSPWRNAAWRAFQLVQIFPRLTVAETIAAAVVTRQGKRWRMLASAAGDAEIAARVQNIAAVFGLQDRLQALSRLLSQGEKKLLDVASAFALQPEVILLDEPTSGVSTVEKHELMKTLVAAAMAAHVKAIILVEHDMDLVAAYSHRVVALCEGRVLADLAPGAFFSDPGSIATVVGKRRDR